MYDAPVQAQGNTAIFDHLDKGFKRSGEAYEIPISKDGRYHTVPERTSQNSVYVTMEEAKSIPTKTVSKSYPEDDDGIEPSAYQETDGIEYRDSFEITDQFNTVYAEMMAPAHPTQSVRTVS